MNEDSEREKERVRGSERGRDGIQMARINIRQEVVASKIRRSIEKLFTFKMIFITFQ